MVIATAGASARARDAPGPPRGSAPGRHQAAHALNGVAGHEQLSAAAPPPCWRKMEAMIPELAPGNRFPDVGLPDHSGHRRRLSELAGGDPLVLNFYRGYW